MTGEISITVIGNLTNDPELRYTPSGAAVANFTIASTPRTFDRQAGEWKDGDTLFLRASVWREQAEHVAGSMAKGSRVIASGVLKPRTYETRTGEKRTVIELEVDEIGQSLRYTAAAPTSSKGSRPAAGTPAGNETGKGSAPAGTHPADEFSISSREYADDDPWFGLHANPAGRITPPAQNGEPAF
jgi:single-strand DNA-binding protein